MNLFKYLFYVISIIFFIESKLRSDDCEYHAQIFTSLYQTIYIFNLDFMIESMGFDFNANIGDEDLFESDVTDRKGFKSEIIDYCRFLFIF